MSLSHFSGVEHALKRDRLIIAAQKIIFSAVIMSLSHWASGLPEKDL